jgi:hypothetical protein
MRRGVREGEWVSNSKPTGGTYLADDGAVSTKAAPTCMTRIGKGRMHECSGNQQGGTCVKTLCISIMRVTSATPLCSAEAAGNVDPLKNDYLTNHVNDTSPCPAHGGRDGFDLAILLGSYMISEGSRYSDVICSLADQICNSGSRIGLYRFFQKSKT